MKQKACPAAGKVMEMKTLVKNGTLVTETGVFPGDLLIEDGKIAAIAESLEAPEAEVIDASGTYVLPGAVDIHTHMDLDVGIARAVDDFYTGTVAAACGGTTTIVDHLAFGPKGCSPWEPIREYHRLADGNAVIDYGFHGVLQHVNEDVLCDMADLAQQEGVTSFKVYMTYNDMLQDEEILQVLEQAKAKNIMIAFHCENDGIVTHLRKKFVREQHTEARFHPLSRPAEAEAEAVNRLLYLAQVAGEAPVYVVHLSSEKGLEEVMRARLRGQKHFGVETCPQYLLLTDAAYEDPQEGLKAIMSPPLRKEKDQEALWQALREGEIDTVATDHCPFTFANQKQQGAKDFTACPSGAPGVEERLRLMYSEGVRKDRITLQQLAEYCCTNPARIAGLYPKKGVLRQGADGDLVLLDPRKETVLSACGIHGAADYTCYEGWKLSGAIALVMQRGQVIVREDQFLGARGAGQYLKRGTSSLCR